MATSTHIPLITLNNGVEMPVLGFGVYQIPPEQTEQAVTDALAAGYRSLDTAAAYRNEEAVGRAVESRGIAREELFVTTKLWIQDPGEDNTRRAFETSLQRLGLDYLDLYLIHQPFGDVYSEWRAMEDLHREGRIRAIGVSNFHPDRLVDLIDHNEIVPAVNQIETHPFFQRTDDQQLMRERGVQMESWGPFAEGRNNLFSDPVLSEIGAGHAKSVAQVVLRWLVQREVVVIPKSVRPERMAENIDVFDFALTDAEMARIAQMDTAVLQPPRPAMGQPARHQPRRLTPSGRPGSTSRCRSSAAASTPRRDRPTGSPATSASTPSPPRPAAPPSRPRASTSLASCGVLGCRPDRALHRTDLAGQATASGSQEGRSAGTAPPGGPASRWSAR